MVQVPTDDGPAGGGGIPTSVGAPEENTGSDGDTSLVLGTADVQPGIVLTDYGVTSGNHSFQLVLSGDLSGTIALGFNNGVETLWSDPFSIGPDGYGDTMIGRVDTAMHVGQPPFAPLSVSGGSGYDPDNGVRVVTMTFFGQTFVSGEVDDANAVLAVHEGPQPAIYMNEGGVWVPKLYGTDEPMSAQIVPYDNASSGLASVELQGAVDEIAGGMSGGVFQRVRGFWDFDVDGGAAGLISLRDVNGDPLVIDEGSIVFALTVHPTEAMTPEEGFSVIKLAGGTQQLVSVFGGSGFGGETQITSNSSARSFAPGGTPLVMEVFPTSEFTGGAFEVDVLIIPPAVA